MSLYYIAQDDKGEGYILGYRTEALLFINATMFEGYKRQGKEKT